MVTAVPEEADSKCMSDEQEADMRRVCWVWKPCISMPKAQPESRKVRLAGTICVIPGENLIDAEKATEAEWPRDVVQVVIGGGEGPSIHLRVQQGYLIEHEVLSKHL